MEQAHYDDIVESTGLVVPEGLKRIASRAGTVAAALTTGLFVMYPSPLAPEAQAQSGSTSNTTTTSPETIVTGLDGSPHPSDTSVPSQASPVDIWPNVTNTS